MITSTLLLTVLMIVAMLYNAIGLPRIKDIDTRDAVEMIVSGVYIGMAIGVMLNVILRP